MPARYFVDETDLSLGKRLDAHYGNVVYPGHDDLVEVPRGSLDDDWLPIIGERHLVVITRDQRIRYRPAEKQAWVAHRVRGCVLTGKRSQSTADSLAVLGRHWSEIDALVDAEPHGPWMRAVTARALRPVPLTR